MTRIFSSLTTAAALCVVLAASAPAHASLTHNSLTHNALASTGSRLGGLNGVAVEVVTLPDELAR